MFDGIDNAYPLTPLQEGILYEVLKAPDSDIYVAYVLIDIEGPLDESVFKQAWATTLQEHDTLRTRFVWEELDEPLQLVDSAATVSWETVEAPASVAVQDPAEQIDQWLHHERLTPLSLSEQPPLRFRLIRFDSARATLIWTVHHLLADDWSTPIVLKSVLERYSQLKADVPISAGAQTPPLAFSDYVEWVNTTDFSASELWWTNSLQGAEPTTIVAGHVQGHSACDLENPFHPRLICQLDLKTAEAISAFSTQTGVTQSSLFHAAWALTLSQYAGSLHPMFGTSVSGRTCPLPGIDSAVGLFLNTVPTRIHINTDQTPTAFALSVQSLLFDQMSHEHLPLSAMQSVTKALDQAAVPTSLFESVLVVESHGRDLDLASSNKEVIRFGSIRYETDSNYPLTVLVFPAEQPEVHFLARADFIDRALMAQLSDSFTHVLANLCNPESTNIAYVLGQHQSGFAPLLSDAQDGQPPNRPESATASATLPATAFESMDQWLIDVALAHFDEIAVTHKDQHLCYGALLQRAVSLAINIERLSPQSDCIGVYIDRSIDQIVGVLAVLFSGRGYLALDVEWPEQRIQQMVLAADCSLVIAGADTSAPFATLPVHVLDVGKPFDKSYIEVATDTQALHDTTLDKHDPEQHGIDKRGIDKRGIDEHGLNKHRLNKRAVETAFASLRHSLIVNHDEDRLAYLMFTSGSTGTPKSVPVSHRNLCYSTAARHAYYPEKPTAYLLLSSLAFDSSVAGVFWTLCSGGTLVLPNERGNDVHELAKLIEQQRVSHTLCLPSLYSLLLQYAKPEKLQSLTTVIVAGEACPNNLPVQHQHALPATRLYNEYGPTEATVWASVACLSPSQNQSLQANDANDIPIGKPIPGTQIQVCNSLGMLCPTGIIGEIVITSPGVIAGYRTSQPHIDELFENCLVADTRWGERHSYRSGDLGFIGSDGHLYFSGRKDEQVKIRGYRVEPAEITWRVETQDDVLAAYCLPSSTQQLLCYVVPTGHDKSGPCCLLEGEGVDTLMERIVVTASQRIAQELPAYFAVSRFVAVSCLPRLPNGKIDKHGFPSSTPTTNNPSWIKTLNHGDGESDTGDNPTAKQLCQLLEDQLGTTGITGQDNFFSLGGDSLSAIRFVARCREQGLALSIPMVSQYSTLHALGQALDKNATQGLPVSLASSSVKPFGETPLTPIQRWFFSQDMPRPEQWNMGFTVTLSHSVDCDVLTHIIERVIGSLHVLGTCFVQRQNQWTAHIPEYVDVSNLVLRIKQPKDNEAWAAALAEAQTSFELTGGKLLRCVLAENMANNSCQTFGVVIHHLITDALSNQLLVDRLVSALNTNDTHANVDSTTSYRAWATQVSDAIAITQGDPPPAPIHAPAQTPWRECDVISTRCRIDQHLLTDLIAYCQNTDTELHEAILYVLMRSVSRQAAVQLHMEMHGRDVMSDVIDVSGAIGWFTNFYPVLDCDTDNMSLTAFTQLLRTSQTTGQEAFLQNPEGFLSAGDQLESHTDNIKIPLLFNFLVGANSQGTKMRAGAGAGAGNSMEGTRTASSARANADASVNEAANHTHYRARVHPVLDARLRHPDSIRTHPIDCVILDSESDVGEIDVLWRIDRDVMQGLNMSHWQADFMTQLTTLCREEPGRVKTEDNDFSDSGLDDDELARLLDSF